jgi:hypothetical protein
LRDNAEAIAKLTPEEDALYGKFYRGFQTAASESHHGSASEPNDVAKAVVAALTNPEPETRYVVGEDSRQLIGAAQSMSDREVDGMFAQMFGT